MYPRFRFVRGPLPDHIISSPEAAYCPSYNKEAPWTIWMSLTEPDNMVKLAYNFCHELGHYLINVALWPLPNWAQNAVQTNYDRVCRWPMEKCCPRWVKTPW